MSGARQEVGGHAAFCCAVLDSSCDWNFGYQRRNTSSNSSGRQSTIRVKPVNQMFAERMQILLDPADVLAAIGHEHELLVSCMPCDLSNSHGRWRGFSS